MVFDKKGKDTLYPSDRMLDIMQSFRLEYLLDLRLFDESEILVSSINVILMNDVFFSVKAVNLTMVQI